MNTQASPLNRTAVPLRPPETVMRLKRMGSFHHSRLSFMRVLLRNLKTYKWVFDRPVWRIDENGVGVATYTATRTTGEPRTYTLVAFAHDLPPEKRSDRVIAEAWDATFTLFDGVPTEDDIERLSGNVPLQEAGRISQSEFSLARANRSVRLFEHVVDRLANGEQPDRDEVERVGYLMRTTAVYGSGKFGAADRDNWSDRPEFGGSFRPELLLVWLVRSFTLDIVEHLAHARSPETATTIDPELRRRFGVGNSTGLGMAPYLINHPALIHAWINARETALARVRSLESANEETASRLQNLLHRAILNADGWLTESEHLADNVVTLRSDLRRLANHLQDNPPGGFQPWDMLYRWAEEHLSLEGQEQLVSLLIDAHGPLVDELAETTSVDEAAFFRIDGSMSVGKLRRFIEEIYGWALSIPFGEKHARARLWYVSEEKLEPRLAERFEEDLEPWEQPLAPGRDAAAAYRELDDWDEGKSVAGFLLRHPEHRHIVRRIQIAAKLPYAEIRDNTISAEMLPIDLLRCKLSFFGATKFDPRSDRWVRINMYQGAPFPHELSETDPDDLFYPPLEA
ncbi:MAG: hypothetical protein AB3N20_07695 [Rhizobiaceae bacterium]